MSKVLRADFFELRKSKIIYLLPVGAVLLGMLMPLMYYGIKVLFAYIGNLEMLKDDPTMQSLIGALGILDAKSVFISALPLSQGFGLVLIAIIGFRAARPFTTGIYRNKVIAAIPRSAIYLSEFLICLLLSVVGAALYTVSAALTSRLTFGTLNLTENEILTIALITFGIYLVYTAIPVFTAFLTRSTPLTIVVAILLPILMSVAVSIAGTVMLSAPDSVLYYILSAFPSFQSVLMSGGASGTALAIALTADVVWTVLLTVFGILNFRKTDMK